MHLLMLNSVQDADFDADTFDTVIAEPVVNITNWVRGTEYLNLLSPRVHPMALLGLGTSVGTPTPINATALVVSSFSDLNSSCALAKGKIVVYNVRTGDLRASQRHRTLQNQDSCVQ